MNDTAARKMLSGIDLFVGHGPAPRVLLAALEIEAGIGGDAVTFAGVDIDRHLASFDRSAWAVVYPLSQGDFAWKVDLDGHAQRDYAAIVRRLASRLSVPIACEDTTLGVFEQDVLYRVGWPDARVVLEPCGEDGSMRIAYCAPLRSIAEPNSGEGD